MILIGRQWVTSYFYLPAIKRYLHIHLLFNRFSCWRLLGGIIIDVCQIRIPLQPLRRDERPNYYLTSRRWLYAKQNVFHAAGPLVVRQGELVAGGHRQP